MIFNSPYCTTSTIFDTLNWKLIYLMHKIQNMFCFIEFSCWKGQINDLEKIQKAALKVILGEEYFSYTSACEHFDLIPLSERRLDLCTNYALKLYASDRSSEFFQHATKDIPTRGDQDPLLENLCRTTRCYNAPHNYLTRLVNQNSDKLKQRK